MGTPKKICCLGFNSNSRGEYPVFVQSIVLLSFARVLANGGGVRLPPKSGVPSLDEVVPDFG